MATALAQTGHTREIVFTVPRPALDWRAVCEYFGFRPSSATIAGLKKQPGFPEGIRPWGATGSERWNVEELDAWRLNVCLRSSAGVQPGKWADNDPRRLRANARKAAAEAARAQSAKDSRDVVTLEAHQ